MIEIPLTQGQIALVDDIDADLADFKWYARWNANTKSYYAQRKITTVNGKQKHEHMHRVILSRMVNRPLKITDKTDHIHGSTLDNRRSEIRLATNRQNCANSGKQSNNTSGFKGVSWDRGTNKWVAKIRVYGKKTHLGLYGTAEEAARAYDEKAKEVFGEFAYLNFPEET